ncbi:MAG TPA: LysM peptidoglycan-binding domain-containing protein [Candidatus Limnocylindria bacterium]|nr:LysM peptidoglycan-binding domain-containing protein [Candidatus Limnocylindria bacterium]
MPVGAITLAALLVASPQPAWVGPEVPAQTQEVAASSSDSTRVEVDELLTALRAAYQAAWVQRQAGELPGAAQTSEAALNQIGSALAGDVDAARRRDLVEVQAKLIGLRDAVRRQLDHPPSPSTSAEERQVLNAPAVEEIEPQFNADVYRWIEFFTGNGRSVFERWLKRSGQYMDLFRLGLQKEGIPPDLVHLVFVESGFNVHARSTAAAVGPWQFLRSTGRLFGLTVNQWVDERKDPEKSTVAAARYLKHLYAIFGDWPLALASYNAGEGTVLRAIKRQGTTNYWDLRLPRQTEEYVPQFMAVLAISREPQKYGFDAVELDDPMRFDELALKGAVDLRAIAKLADCTYEEIRYLNPAVLRHAAPGRDGVTTIRVPKGKGEVLLGKLQNGAELPAVDLTVKHHVRRGETLQGIANQYHVGATQLAASNGISRKRPLKRGMVLTVRPTMKSMAPAELEPSDPRASTAYVPPRPRSAPKSLGADSNAEGRITVTVRKGETLRAIADRYDVSVADIQRWNRLTTSTVRRGTRLKIRTGDRPTVAEAAADSARIAALKPPPGKRKASQVRGKSAGKVRAVVIVKRGETLSEIASRNRVTVQQLKRANGLGSSRIRAGQRLKIPA